MSEGARDAKVIHSNQRGGGGEKSPVLPWLTLNTLQIRKRKLEKADILELSVKYMKSLQHSVQGNREGVLPQRPEEQTGCVGWAVCAEV